MRSIIKEAIIIDLDGTLCNNEHRRHYIEGKNKDFKKFYEGISKDKVNDWCNDIIINFDNGCYDIILLTGREGTEKVINDTKKWLENNCIIYNKLFFPRKPKDYRPDTEVKAEIYENEIKDKYDIQFCIDDRQSVVDMWRSKGLICLQCAKGDF